ncbi:hypothetical protein CR513_40474, partial [Mucuna pruriens]
MKRVPIKSWDELKREMRERFVPSFYTRDLYIKLQRLYQGSKSVEEYFKEMEVTIVKIQVVKSQEATMVSFLHGLNREIQYIVELHHYNSLVILVHQATKVELQLKRHGKKSYPSTNGESYCEEDLLMVRRLMRTLVGEDVKSQRENIFHSKCLVQGSSVNIANLRLVDKLVILILPYLRP